MEVGETHVSVCVCMCVCVHMQGSRVLLLAPGTTVLESLFSDRVFPGCYLNGFDSPEMLV